MIYVNFVDNIYMLRFLLLENGTTSNVLYTTVSIEGKIYNYYQKDDTIIITSQNYHNEHKDDYNKLYLCSPIRHISNLENLEKYYIKFNGNVINNLIFVDKSRLFKLNKLYKQI